MYCKQVNNKMSYFLYSNFKENTSNSAVFKILNDHGFRNYKIVKQKEIAFASDIKIEVLVRITEWLPAGCSDYAMVLRDIKSIKPIKSLYLLKRWEGKGGTNKLFPTEAAHINDIDAELIERMNDDTFYRIAYFQRR